MDLDLEFLPPHSLTDEIIHEITTDAERGLTAAAKIIPDFLLRNFELFGAVFGDSEWEPISANSLRKYRKQNRNRFQPLWDTGNLARSGHNLPMEKTKDGSRIDTTLESYGFEHDAGTAITPEGEPVWRRPHMHLYEPDLFEIDEIFESVW